MERCLGQRLNKDFSNEIFKKNCHDEKLADRVGDILSLILRISVFPWWLISKIKLTDESLFPFAAKRIKKRVG